jgi:transmembrane sensor
MGTVDHRVRSVIEHEAIDWFVLNRGGCLSEEQQSAFGAWLKSSPLHVEEYLRTAVLSRNLRAAADTLEIDMAALTIAATVQDDDVIQLRQTGGYGRSTTPPHWLMYSRKITAIAAIAAVVLLTLAAVLWTQRDGQRFGLPREFETMHGEQRSWLLPDGSGLSLNADSAVIVRYSRRERVVQVERGQALFQVAHESARRFRVVVGEASVIAIGTEFDVLRSYGSTLITVVQGRVAVFSGDDVPLATAPALLPVQALSVSAGEQVRINVDSPRSAATAPSVVAVNVQQAVAWVQHQIAFDRQPLGEVTEEFNRYSGVPIVIQSSRLRALPISGVFNQYDSESFLAFIARLDSVRIERSAGRILIVDKSR